jgi:hypothetical protein
MRKYVILAVLVGAAVFAAVSLANTGSGSTSQTQLPGEVKALDAHPMTTAEGKALGVKASAKRSKFALRYLFADINVGAGQTKGGAIKCPGKKWHPVSGLFSSASNRVVTASDMPVSLRKWAIFVRNEGASQAKVTVGAVCEKGLPVTGSG